MMKKLYQVIILLGVALTATAQQAYTLRGTLSGLAEGTAIQLIPMSHDNEKPIAETTVKAGGQYKFAGTVDFPRCVFFRVKDAYGGESLIINGGDDITLSATVREDKSWDGTPQFTFTGTKVTGSPLTDRLNVYKQKRADLDKLYNETHDPYKAIWDEVGRARQANDKAKYDSLMNTPDVKRAEEAEHQFFMTVEKTYGDAINENRDTYWGPLLALYYMSYFTAEQKPLWESFSKEAQDSWYGQKMKSEVFPAGQTGERVPAFSVRDDDGRDISLEQVCKGKKFVLIDFWASWCGPCRKEIPNVKAQYALYKDKGLEVLSISTDKKEDAWRKALAEEKLEWPNFRDTNGVADLYKVRSIPAMFLINAQDQTIIAYDMEARGEALAKKLAELFK